MRVWLCLAEVKFVCSSGGISRGSVYLFQGSFGDCFGVLSIS
ncbi:hypothetical protein KC19_5G047900 [Ceratodon purpureus]|uniref:Uncharacterized protein n=1 Tax=Ceratodon purpureus TaxID=3225 RepID=A0A8T0HY08_CERPU|nr:hypothetical protein KC19_5G047900 [Ceratodon purpureus]